jgi:hypothetical protein
MSAHLRSLALAALGLALAGTVARAETQEEMARDLVPAQKPMVQLGGGSAEAVDAWVDNPSLTYRVGQQLKVFVRPRQTSFVTVLNVGSSGRVTVIFPNFYQRDTRVPAGQTVAIPAERAGWRIDVVGPPGIEVVKVIATPEPLALPELQRLAATTERSPILSLGRSGEEVARDIVPQIEKPTGVGLVAGGFRNLLVRVLPLSEGTMPAPRGLRNPKAP